MNGRVTNLKLSENLTSARAIELVCTDLKLARSSYELFSIWAIGSDFGTVTNMNEMNYYICLSIELQLESHHSLKKIYTDWPLIEQRFAETSNSGNVLSPISSPGSIPKCKFELKRWAFLSKFQDGKVQDPIALSLLYFEARVFKRFEDIN